jgi:hypothetical protein
MPNVTINPPATINVRVGTATSPKVALLSYGSKNLKDVADLSFIGAQDGDVIVYKATTNSFAIESVSDVLPDVDAGFF